MSGLRVGVLSTVRAPVLTASQHRCLGRPGDGVCRRGRRTCSAGQAGAAGALQAQSAGRVVQLVGGSVLALRVPLGYIYTGKMSKACPAFPLTLLCAGWRQWALAALPATLRQSVCAPSRPGCNAARSRELCRLPRASLAPLAGQPRVSSCLCPRGLQAVPSCGKAPRCLCSAGSCSIRARCGVTVIARGRDLGATSSAWRWVWVCRAPCL